MALRALPSLDAAIHGPRPNAKPVRRQTLKGRKDRVEAKVKQDVRQACMDRDGFCRMALYPHPGDRIYGEMTNTCRGFNASEWAHMHSRRRSQTRNQAPEVRHDTAHSLMLCRFHHAEYDAHRLHITALSRKGADGPLKFRRAK